MPGWIRGWRMIEGGRKRVTLSAAKGPTPRLARVLSPGVALMALVGACVFATLGPTVLRAQSLSKRLYRRLDAPPMDRNLWGVALVDEKGALRYGRNARQLFNPASNTKIVVAAVSSALLAPDWTVRTSLYADGPVANGVVQGDLVLYGRGDPTFGKRCFATDTLREGACETDSYTRLRDLADGLRARGIREVHGDLVGDGSYFEATTVHPGWENF